jgi:hypothetical protein
MWKNRPNDETLEAFTHESREYISATSVFCTDGLQSGRDYLYPEQDFEVQFGSFSCLRPGFPAQ